MKKRAIALALGWSFLPPGALAQVQIYGKLYPQFVSVDTSGATPAGSTVSTLGAAPNGLDFERRNEINTSNSYVGFRGQEDLGGAVRVIWQIEQAVSFDTGGSQVWANRDSFVGLTSNFGTLKFGNLDTVYKNYGDTFSMFGISSGNFVSASNVLSHIGFGNNRTARFHERRPNSIQYLSPEFGGVEFGAQYSPDETHGNPGTTLNADLWSFGIKYESERYYLSLAHEIHNDTFGGSRNVPAALANLDNPDARAKDTATRVSAEFRGIAGHRFVADFALLEYKETGQDAVTPRFEEYRHNTWALGWDARWGGPWRTAVQYVSAAEGSCSLTLGAPCNTDGLDGELISLGVAYTLSRRTFIYLIGARLNNGHSAVYDNMENASPSPGSDSTQVALGISHTF